VAERDITFSQHAETVIFERAIEREWIIRTLSDPEAVEPDLARGTFNALRAIPEHGGRVLNVAYAEIGNHIHVITIFFDRKKTRQRKRP
jgi:hypothetical protein